MTITDKQFQAARAVAGEMGFSAVEMSDNEIRAIVEAAEAARESITPAAFAVMQGSKTLSVHEYRHDARDEAETYPDKCSVEVVPLFAAPSSAEQAGKVEHIGGWRINRDTDTVEHEQDGAWHYWGTVAEFESNRFAPSAPAADERSRFEAETFPFLTWRGSQYAGRSETYMFQRADGSDEYFLPAVEGAWIGWQISARRNAPARAQAGEAATACDHWYAVSPLGRTKLNDGEPDAQDVAYSERTHATIVRLWKAPPADARDGEDARRYRWLRAWPNNVSGPHHGVAGLMLREEYLDAAIDRAMGGE